MNLLIVNRLNWGSETQKETYDVHELTSAEVPLCFASIGDAQHQGLMTVVANSKSISALCVRDSNKKRLIFDCQRPRVCDSVCFFPD